jgi:hypothetical protein
MIGGPPMSFDQPFVPAFPQGQFAAPVFHEQAPWQQPRVVPPRPVQQPARVAAPAPVFRGQASDEPSQPVRPALVTIPPPEQLGVRPDTRRDGSSADWSAARQRLKELGASCFQVQELRGGGCRFICLLSTGKASYTHRVEVEADTEAEAIRKGLEQAELAAKR